MTKTNLQVIAEMTKLNITWGPYVPYDGVLKKRVIENARKLKSMPCADEFFSVDGVMWMVCISFDIRYGYTVEFCRAVDKYRGVLYDLMEIPLIH